LFFCIACDTGSSTGSKSSSSGGGATPQSATLANLFSEGRSATIKGNFTNSEWGSGTTGIASKFRTALEAAYTGNLPPVQSQFLSAFGQSGVTIIVEKTTAYTNWKTTGDGKTLYIRFDKLDSIQSALTAAVQSMDSSGTQVGNIPAPTPTRIAKATQTQRSI
jgi:hypothetical protein